jgi:hypothetical protein
MHAIAFLNSEILDIPKSRGRNEFEPFVGRMLDEFLAFLGDVRPRDHISQCVRATYGLAEVVIADLKTCVGQAIRGEKDEAYETLKRVIANLGARFEHLFPPRDVTRELKYLYRMREIDKENVAKGELFHCPFQLRDNISAQRYSAAKIPCLYFGGSSYLCWDEIRGKDKNKAYISRFEVAGGVKLNVVNLAYRPALIAAMLNANLEKANQEGDTADFVLAEVACWPLMAVCAVRRPDGDQNALEYLVPQMLLRWVVEAKQYDGIRFFSTRINRYFDDPKTTANYVFPAKTERASGYCNELASRFKMTEPLRWRDALRIKPSQVVLRPRYKDHGQAIASLEEEYGYVESVLDDLPTFPIF